MDKKCIKHNYKSIYQGKIQTELLLCSQSFQQQFANKVVSYINLITTEMNLSLHFQSMCGSPALIELQSNTYGARG